MNEQPIEPHAQATLDRYADPTGISQDRGNAIMLYSLAISAKRQADALERIADSLLKLASPPMIVETGNAPADPLPPGKIVRRCMGPWPRCGHARGDCTAGPDYQASIMEKGK